MNKISVITISYNSVSFIKNAIDSVLKQNYFNFEHIIIDGASNDGTVEIIKKYSHLIWVSEIDNGQSDAMNKGFNLATGDIIVYLNADDYFYEGVFIEVERLFSKPNAQVVIGNLVIKSENKYNFIKTEKKYINMIHPDLFGFPYNPICYFYKKNLQEKVGSFPLSEYFAMDYWFVIRAFENVNIVKSDMYFGVFEHHINNKTSVNGGLNENRLIKEFINSKSYFYRLRYYIDDFLLSVIQKIIFKAKKNG